MLSKEELARAIINVLNYAQPDEEEDFSFYGGDGEVHIVHDMRKLREYANELLK